MIGRGAAVFRFILFSRGPARHTNDLPPSKCEMAKVNCCRPLRQAVALDALPRPVGKEEPPNFACAWPGTVGPLDQRMPLSLWIGLQVS